MIDFDFEPLRALGLTPALASLAVARAHAAADVSSSPSALLRLTEVHRETVRVHDGHHEHSARVLPRLQRDLLEAGTALAVGDWLLATHDAHGQRWLRERLPPATHLSRRDADGLSHPVVSNVDTALLVMGLDDDFNPRRLERYLALVQGSGVQAVVVLSKADVLPSPAALAQRLAALRGRVPRQVEVLAVDATRAAARERLLPWLGAAQTLVLMGSSGAGKSTLTNTLLGQAVQDTGAVREHDSRGKHTTTSRSLHRVPGGACVIDTPGLRALRPDADEATLTASFDDIATLAQRCRFRDCRHHDEPGCAVRDGVPGDRLRNYQKLLREARRDTLSALERQQQVAVWKARGRAARVQMRAKRGDEG